MRPAELRAHLARRTLGAATRGGRAAADLARVAWSRRPGARRAAALAFALLLCVAGVHGLAFQASLPRRLPRAVDWGAARALLERDARPGDAVALSPAWAERAREALPGGVPILAPARFEGELLPGVRRIWLLSIPSAPGFSWQPELDLVRLAARTEALPQLGALALARYALAAPHLPLAFLPDRAASAEVRLGGAACSPAPAGFRCGAEGAVRAERTVREVDGVARPCLSVTLTAPPGAPLELAFPGVPLGRRLRGHAGLAAGAPPGARVRVAVSVDGEEAGAFEVAGPGFRPFELATPELAGELRTVSLVLTWAAPAGELCLDAVTLP